MPAALRLDPMLGRGGALTWGLRRRDTSTLDIGATLAPVPTLGWRRNRVPVVTDVWGAALGGRRTFGARRRRRVSPVLGARPAVFAGGGVCVRRAALARAALLRAAPLATRRRRRRQPLVTATFGRRVLAAAGGLHDARLDRSRRPAGLDADGVQAA